MLNGFIMTKNVISNIIVIIIIIINIMTDNVISIIIFYEGNDTQAPSLTEIQQNYTNVVRALARH